MITITQLEEHLTGQLHGGTLNKVKNKFAVYERAANNLLKHIDPQEAQCRVALTQPVHAKIYDYALPSYFGKLIDFYPVDNRNSLDEGTRIASRSFDTKKLLQSKKISIEAHNGVKFARINWPVSPSPVTLNTMESLTANGAWSIVGTAAGLKINTLYKMVGQGSIEFDLVTTGDGIQNSSMTAVDLLDMDEVGQGLFWIYLGSVTNLTSLQLVWGNDLTTNYWTSAAITAQADGSTFATGWNLVAAEWSTATETGTVAPASIDSAKVLVTATGTIANIRVDNIVFSKGRIFEAGFYSKYLFQTAAGVWIARPTTGDDLVMLDQDALNCYYLECLKAAAHQIEGEDSGFDIKFADDELHGNGQKTGLYRAYKRDYPSQALKLTGSYASLPRFQR